VNDRPIPIHTADSMAASFVVGAWGLRCTISRSATSSTVTKTRNAIQTQTGTSKLAKLPSSDDEASDARTARDENTSYLRLGDHGNARGDYQPKVSPATGAVITGPCDGCPPLGRTDDDHIEGYSPSVPGVYPPVPRS
jgi:hypothetical protein